jgi:hypothetical protein
MGADTPRGREKRSRLAMLMHRYRFDGLWPCTE